MFSSSFRHGMTTETRGSPALPDLEEDVGCSIVLTAITDLKRRAEEKVAPLDGLQG
jgi:hypothetical protein